MNKTNMQPDESMLEIDKQNERRDMKQRQKNKLITRENKEEEFAHGLTLTEKINTSNQNFLKVNIRFKLQPQRSVANALFFLLTVQIVSFHRHSCTWVSGFGINWKGHRNIDKKGDIKLDTEFDTSFRVKMCFIYQPC